jgi:hypothetical protein
MVTCAIIKVENKILVAPQRSEKMKLPLKWNSQIRRQ